MFFKINPNKSIKFNFILQKFLYKFLNVFFVIVYSFCKYKLKNFNIYIPYF